MATATLNITRSRDNESTSSSSSGISVTLEQTAVKSSANVATPAMIIDMINADRNGESATMVLSDYCPYVTNGEVDGQIIVSLGFYVFPNDPALDVAVTSSSADITGPIYKEIEKSFSLPFRSSADEYYDYFLSSQSAALLMPAFNDDGQEISVSYAAWSNHATLSEDATLVLAVEGMAYARRYQADITINRKKTVSILETDGTTTTESIWIEVDSPSCAVLATWTDEDGNEQTTQLTLDIPSCVDAFLTSCPDTDEATVSLNNYGDDHPTESVQRVYYNTCSGKVVGSHIADEPMRSV